MDNIYNYLRNYEIPNENVPPLLANVKSRLNKNSDTILFGASEGGVEIFQKLSDLEVEVDYFCDNNISLWGTEFCGKLVLSPSELLGLLDPDILISSSFQTEIYSQLKGMGFQNVYHFPLVDIISAKHYNIEYHIKNSKLVAKAFDLLATDQSKAVFACLIRYRLEQDLEHIKMIRTNDMYLPECIINSMQKDATIFDVGAYNGDTVDQFLRIKNVKNIYAFEPELSNYEKIRNKFSANKSVIAENMVISNHTGKMYISNEGAESSVSNKHSSDAMEVLSSKLDDYCGINKLVPSYLKMDVEGFERQVLAGAQQLIKEHKPLMAISIYHRASDLWKIPLLVKEINQEYRIQLMHHSYNICDSVLYCY